MALACASAVVRADDADDAEARKTRMQNSLEGSTGGIHLVNSFGGPHRTFRVGLAGEVFAKNGFVSGGDEAKHLAALLSFSWTAHPNIEVFGFAQSRMRRIDTGSGQPTLYASLGSPVLGVKGFYALKTCLTVGGDVTIRVPSALDDTGGAFKGADAAFRVLGTWDLRKLKRHIPLMARLNIQYEFDRSAKLIANAERSRYAALSDPRPFDTERRQRLLTSELFGYGIDRVDSLNRALASNFRWRSAIRGSFIRSSSGHWAFL
ncbi:MAG: hypothetical protein R3A47_01215 [Polyangiales bacterium]